MHSKKENVKRAQKQGSADGSKVPTSGGKRPRPQGEPGMNYAGGTPGFYDKGGPGAPGKVFEGGELPKVGYPGGGNGARPQPTPGPGGRPPRRGDGENTIGIPRGEVGSPFNGGQPPQFGGGGRPQPTPGPGARRQRPTNGPEGFPGPGNSIPRRMPQFGSGMPQFGSGPRKFGGDDMNYINR